MRGRRRVPGPFGPLIGRPIAQFLSRVYWHTTVRGADLVPRRGPVVVIANHVGFIDGPIVAGVIPRSSNFLVKQDMFRHGLGVILRGTGQIEVAGTGREALARAKGVLARGGVVGVFPEGTRGTGDAACLAGGAAWLAIHGKAPVVPLALFGTRHTGESVNIWPKPRRRILAVFGEPVELDIPPEFHGQARQKMAEEAVAAALREHVRRAEAQSDIPLPHDEQPEETP